jgi:hypothetical protein
VIWFNIAVVVCWDVTTQKRKEMKKVKKSEEEKDHEKKIAEMVCRFTSPLCSSPLVVG